MLDILQQVFEFTGGEYNVDVPHAEDVENLISRKHPVDRKNNVSAACYAKESCDPLITRRSDDGNMSSAIALIHHPRSNCLDITCKL